MSLGFGSPAVLCGRLCKPFNDLAAQVAGTHGKSIHDSSVAQKVGFNTAPIHGTTHFTQFSPLLIRVFGNRWLESGSLSIHFVSPVGHLEPVQCFVDLPTKENQTQVKVWMNKENGTRVLQGTASVGTGNYDETEVDKQINKLKARGGQENLTLQLIKGMKVGAKLNPELSRVCINFDDYLGSTFPYVYREKLDRLTEDLPCYHGNNAVLPFEMLNVIMLYTRRNESYEGVKMTPGVVGLFGGCEIKVFNGPVRVGVEYWKEGEIIAVGESPKTEFYWEKVTLWDSPQRGKKVAEMRLMNRVMKTVPKL
eukprot:TRINITY_DN115051_c0_g1_i1.p1 TRINITY_DN115051_c0_g1~~TRINITY_DN115051_c0_g1_i1.p1  ORF type:complete len:309 (+),score=24.34 TRINITY_DN115051_c0_g1_i1:35-961(+)